MLHRITSPLLLLAIAASLGGCYILSLRNAEKLIIVAGHELSLAHQYAAVGVLSLPVFYIAGAGAVIFWVLGTLLSLPQLLFIYCTGVEVVRSVLLINTI